MRTLGSAGYQVPFAHVALVARYDSWMKSRRLIRLQPQINHRLAAILFYFTVVALLATHPRMNVNPGQVLVAVAEKREEWAKQGLMPTDPIYIVDGEIPRRNTRPHEQT